MNWSFATRPLGPRGASYEGGIVRVTDAGKEILRVGDCAGFKESRLFALVGFQLLIPPGLVNWVNIHHCAEGASKADSFDSAPRNFS